MRSTLFRARASIRVQKQLTRVRKLRDRWIDHPSRQIEQARRQLLTGDVDVLVLGDSSTLCWSLRDTDRTMIPELLGQRLGSNVVSVAGPGYGARVYSEVLRILGTLEQRPKAVVIATAIRATSGTHIVEHPTTSYARSLASLAKVKTARRRVRSLGRGGSFITPEADAAYRALPVHSRWADDVTIGDYRKQLEGQGPPPWPIELEKLRFDFFHGEYVRDDDPQLAKLTELGRQIDAYGVPTVVYWTRPPKQRGEMHFPGEFEDHVRANLAVVEGALVKDCTSVTGMIDVDLEDEDYEDSQNGNEHYSFSGRTKLTDAIADRIRDLTEELS
ncbi:MULTISPECIES: hypothetical protein [unclassified Nocardioides]|uniref:hypothetical protein n=1 Tax=unclassified Nocardioides TaxID=2615069 RepID=UPI0006F4C6B3|nr:MULTISPECIES: hypothetical protein [unclassified Nocardioides]KRA38573.1 hypothetical protein ASD81_08135 [Nocardioides sp. Root614]KRA92533.1 hypothetical protein ASD84_08400 [Nocardioides sp. Root682]